MAKFKYKLQNILDIKLKMESQAKTSYSTARNKLNEEQAKLENMFAKKKLIEDKYRSEASGILNVLRLRECRNEIDYVKNQIKGQLVEVKVAQKNLELARIRLNEVMKERKTYEKLRENAFEVFLQDLNDQEKKEIDELVSYKYNSRTEE